MIPLAKFYLNITLLYQELNTEDPANPVLPGYYKLSKKLLRSWDGSRHTIIMTPPEHQKKILRKRNGAPRCLCINIIIFSNIIMPWLLYHRILSLPSCRYRMRVPLQDARLLLKIIRYRILVIFFFERCKSSVLLNILPAECCTNF